MVVGVSTILGGGEVSDEVRRLALVAWVLSESGFGSYSVREGRLELRAIGKLRRASSYGTGGAPAGRGKGSRREAEHG
jgi:hypothetical protein